MREIKFRAKLSNNWWIYGSNKKKNRGGFGWAYENGDVFSLKEFFQIISNEKSKNLTGYIGLKDKNGKEIYEGDILRYGNEKDDIIIEIVWNDLSDNGFKIIRQANKNISHDIRSYRFDTYAEIIGNIWEHSHLLKESK